MYNPAVVLANSFGDCLADAYRMVYSSADPDFGAVIRSVARLIIERIASSDALYHDVQHTMMVTQVGQAILRGRIMIEEVKPSDWLHFTIATLCHDIGYLRGICPGDEEGRYVIDGAGTMVDAPRGASDAFLAPYHIERGKLFVLHRCRQIPYLSAERIAAAIELTRFPVPLDDDHADTGSEAALVRAADLIGQLGDPLYSRKANALFWEFEEIGMNRQLGYSSPADLIDRYPSFYWNTVSDHLHGAIKYLAMTVSGRQWIANLHHHVLCAENDDRLMGPQR